MIKWTLVVFLFLCSCTAGHEDYMNFKCSDLCKRKGYQLFLRSGDECACYHGRIYNLGEPK